MYMYTRLNVYNRIYTHVDLYSGENEDVFPTIAYIG